MMVAAAALFAMGAANGFAGEGTPVRLVSYEQMQASAVSVSSTTSSASSASSSGNQLSWVSVSSPEARTIKAETAPVNSAVGSRARTGHVALRQVSDPASEAAPITDSLDMPDISMDSMSDFGDLSAPIPAPTEQPTVSEVAPEAVPVATTASEAATVPATSAVPTEGLSSGGANSEIPAAVNTNKPRAIEKSAASELSIPSSEDLELPSSKLPVPDSGLVTPIEPNANGTSEDPWKQFNKPLTLDYSCPRPHDMKKIGDITNDISASDGAFPMDCPLTAKEDEFPVRHFAGTCFRWTAANTCHNPLYFEQPAVERYGHTVGFLQPVLSGAQFLITVPALPYLMAMDPVNECEYSLGYYRPGSCAPYMWNPVPFTLRAAIAEGGVATALVFLIP